MPEPDDNDDDHDFFQLLLLLAAHGLHVEIRRGGRPYLCGPTGSLPRGLLHDNLLPRLRRHREALCERLAKREALDAYDLENPPEDPVAMRQVALLEVEPGRWVACDPAAVERSKAWNESIGIRYSAERGRGGGW